MLATIAAAQAPENPRPVRHDTARAGAEFLVLRHQQLVKGSHDDFYDLSRHGVWPLFEKIGTRVVGQWQVVHPEGGGSDEYDEGYRLARYRSYNHWRATRGAWRLAGNGPDYQANAEALRARNELRLGSDGPIFLSGSMAAGGPYYLPVLEETYEAVDPGTDLPADASQPVRNAAAAAGEEIVTLRHFRIAKGTFEEFNRLSHEGVWPYFEKMGARVVGQWRVVYPSDPAPAAASRVTTQESDDYDEAYMMVRYASYEHWQATRPAVMAQLGGNGPDYELCRDSLERRRRITIETSVTFLRGFFYQSPPVYLPALDEKYHLTEQGEQP